MAVVATDATLTKAQCRKVSGIGHDGLARAIHPVHTMYDGDTVFTLATGAGPVPTPPEFHELLTEAADCVTRAVGRALVAAASAGDMRCYRETFPSAFGWFLRSEAAQDPRSRAAWRVRWCRSASEVACVAAAA